MSVITIGLLVTTGAQVPMVTLALYLVAVVRFPVDKIGLTAPVMAVQVGFAAVELLAFCHMISPAKLVKVIVVPFPTHTKGGSASAVPAVAAVATEYFTTFVSSEEQEPFVTNALKKVVPVMLFTAYELAELEVEVVENVVATPFPAVGTFIKLVPLVEYIHWIVPKFPVIVNCLLDPKQTVPPPLIFPGVEAEITFIFFAMLRSILQPLVTTERT